MLTFFGGTLGIWPGEGEELFQFLRTLVPTETQSHRERNFVSKFTGMNRIARRRTPREVASLINCRSMKSQAQ